MIYFALKNLVLWARSEFSGSALEFGVLNHNSQAPNYKLTRLVNLKFQIANSKPVQNDCFFVWDFEFRSLLFICFFWDLLFGISIIYIKSEMLEYGDYHAHGYRI
jgi:hypothetical protein